MEVIIKLPPLTKREMGGIFKSKIESLPKFYRRILFEIVIIVSTL
jgi:hypothetical protein